MTLENIKQLEQNQDLCTQVVATPQYDASYEQTPTQKTKPKRFRTLWSIVAATTLALGYSGYKACDYALGELNGFCQAMGTIAYPFLPTSEQFEINVKSDINKNNKIIESYQEKMNNSLFEDNTLSYKARIEELNKENEKNKKMILDYRENDKKVKESKNKK